MISSVEEFRALCSSEDPAERRRAATDGAPESVWMEIVARHPEMKRCMAWNKVLPHSVLRLLAADPDPDIRCVVAMKRRLEPDLLEQLASDPDESVRQRVACNPKTPTPVLRRLAADPWWGAREAAQKRLGEFVGPSELDTLLRPSAWSGVSRVDLGAVTTWFEAHAARFAGRGATLEHQRPSTDLPKNGTFVDVITPRHLARASVWESGECELEARDADTGRAVLWEYHECAETAEMLAAVDRFARRVLEGDL